MMAIDCFRPTRSRGPAVPSAALATSRSRSWTGLMRLAELAAIGGRKRELLDGVEPIADGFEREQRPQQPPAEQAAANRRDGPVELVEQRSFAAAFGSVEDFQVLERRRDRSAAQSARWR